MNTLRILGTRGVPAQHGGFETFAERLALHLVKQHWQVVVYCQQEGRGPMSEDEWCGVRRIHIPVAGDGSASSVIFDWHATRHAARQGGTTLTLGYNTAVFCVLLRFAGICNVINMDGIEWQRAKWGPIAKTWFWLNERAGCWLGNRLVADHPEIVRHLERRVSPGKITMIPYGADKLVGLSDEPVRALGLEPQTYLTLVARPEPENSVLEVVRAFSRKPRRHTLLILGNYRDSHAYHRAVRAAAGPQVRFVGAIYDPQVVCALRQHCVAYVHGHQVGGTNPSLVEALGAGNAVFAHDNRFNRWVAGQAAGYFHDVDSLCAQFDAVLDDDVALQAMRLHAVARHAAAFTWESVLAQYETLLLDQKAKASMQWTSS